MEIEWSEPMRLLMTLFEIMAVNGASRLYPYCPGFRSAVFRDSAFGGSNVSKVQSTFV
jgi:hypothetical protein